jgi:hypothetical protein
MPPLITRGEASHNRGHLPNQPWIHSTYPTRVSIDLGGKFMFVWRAYLSRRCLVSYH